MKIARAINLEKQEVEKKMRCVLGQLQRDQKKIKTGMGADEVYISKWFALNLLLFLKDKNKPRETTEAGIEKVNQGRTSNYE